MNDSHTTGDGRVPGALIPILYKQTPPGIVAHVVTSSVVAALLWEASGQALLVTWLLSMYVLSALRGTSVWWFSRRPGGGGDVAFWGWLATGFAGAFGLLWGLCPWLFMTPDNPTSLVIVSVINMGLGAGAVVALAPHLPTCLAFALPTQLGLIGALLAEPRPLTLAIAALAGYALAANLTNSVMVHKRLRQNVRLTDENLRLRHEAEEKTRLLQSTLQKITQAREAAERANAAKTRFLASASHDLRQPLHALGLFFEALSAEVRTPATAPLIGRIEESIAALDTMLNALLDISKLDAGVVEPQLGAVSLGPLLQRLDGEFQPQARASGNRLRVRAREACVASDEVMLERLLRNLLSNALRYTLNGHVLVGARVRGAHLRIEVYDTGVGIPAAQCEEIFTEFHQLGNPERDRRQGLGLGLAIVRRIARLLDHEVEVRSRPGRGSCFSVLARRASALRAPAREPSRAGPTGGVGDELRGLRALVVDDDTAILQAMHDLLRRWGMQVESAGSIDGALARVDSAHPPQVLLVDYRLRDGQTGVDAVAALRALLGDPVPAVLLTGDTAPDRLRQARESGIPLLHKPVRPARLRAVLRAALANAPTIGG